jgi:hypothetical protein
MKYLLMFFAIILTGCTSVADEAFKKTVKLQNVQTHFQKSKQQRLKESVVNDYSTYQNLNYQQLKRSNVPDQLVHLNTQINEVVLELVAELKGDSFSKPIIIRPIVVATVENFREGSERVVEEAFEENLKLVGFEVFDDRNPKGKLEGDELILNTELILLSNEFFLLTNIKALDSNKSLVSKRSHIDGFFFKNMEDGVEIYSAEESEFY